MKVDAPSCSVLARAIIGPHYWNDDDCWYSCPLALDEHDETRSCNSEAIQQGRCTCGLERRVQDAAEKIAFLLERGMVGAEEPVLIWKPKPSGDGFYWYMPSPHDGYPDLIPSDLAGDVKVIEVFGGGTEISVADVSVQVDDVSGLFYGPLTPPPSEAA